MGLITEAADRARKNNPERSRQIEVNLIISDRVTTYLKDIGWTMTDLAKKMNKKTSDISRMLSGRHNITLNAIFKLEIALGIDLIKR